MIICTSRTNIFVITLLYNSRTLFVSK
uniref:Uncharacterized protein n=1 Tax=Anguilla anguilla TaxID=7936 RepID=A0A0E9UAV9_ANGAN